MLTATITTEPYKVQDVPEGDDPIRHRAIAVVTAMDISEAVTFERSCTEKFAQSIAQKWCTVERNGMNIHIASFGWHFAANGKDHLVKALACFCVEIED